MTSPASATNSLPEIVYLMAVAEAARQALRLRLLMDEDPSHVRLATLAPLSNYGFGPETTATVLALHDQGFVYGDPNNQDVPRVFVPWTNVAYIADGSALAQLERGVAEGKVGARGFTIQP